MTNPEGDLELALNLFGMLMPDSSDMIYVVVPGPPQSKSRARVNRRTGTMYDPKENKLSEARTGSFMAPLFPKPWEGNIGVGCVFFRPNHQRIDPDNMLKHVLDSANRVVWNDDSQVTVVFGLVELDVLRPRTLIVIGRHVSSLSRAPLPKGICPMCGQAFLRESNNPDRVFCSPACNVRSRSKLMDPIACAQCGEPFKRHTSYQRFCTVKCARASKRGAPRGSSGYMVCECGAPLSKVQYLQCRECWRDPAKRAAPTTTQLSNERRRVAEEAGYPIDYMPEGP